MIQAPKKIIVLGAGFGGTYVMKELHKFFHKNPQVQISLVNEKNYFLFTPLLHEVATGGVNPENIVEPIRKVLGCCLYDFYLGKVDAVDIVNNTIHIGAKSFFYDYLVLAPGSQTNFYGIKGAEKHSFVLKSLENAIELKNHCITQIEKALRIEDFVTRRKMLRFVVVGGGPTGVELVAELQEFLKDAFKYHYPFEVLMNVSVTLIQKDRELLPQFGKKFRQKTLMILQKKGIEILLQTGVSEVTDSCVFLDNGKRIETETVIWVAGIKPATLKFNSPVSLISDGRMAVNEYLQLSEHPNVFALGDSAAIASKKSKTFLPALAQVAVAQASNVAKNIYFSINQKTLKSFNYRHKGNLVSLGSWMAIGEISNLIFWGHITWWFWRTVYLFKLISWQKKIKVAIDWTINLFSSRDISQLP